MIECYYCSQSFTFNVINDLNHLSAGDEKVVYDVNELEAVREINKLDSTSIKPEIDLVKATNWRANNFKPKTYGMYVEICHLCGNKSSHNCHTNICIKVIQCFITALWLFLGLHPLR